MSNTAAVYPPLTSPSVTEPRYAALSSPSPLQTNSSSSSSVIQLASPASVHRSSQDGSVVVNVPPRPDDEKEVAAAIASPGGFQSMKQELSLRINTLTARRTAVSGATTAVEDPEALAADLAKEDSEQVETTAHFLPVSKLAEQLRTSLQDGLSPSQVAVNRSEYGVNIVSPAAEVSYVLLFAQQLVSGFNALLWIACIVIFLSWQPLGSLNGLVPAPVNVAVAALLLVVIFVQAVFNLYMIVGAIRIVKSFAEIRLGEVRVRRGGKEETVPAEELVVGDLVHVSAGQRIPADLRLVEAHDMQVDNSALTGESEPISCSVRCSSANFMESSNMAFLGTACPQGSGLGIVVATGDQAVIGQINSLTQGNDSLETSLHREIIGFVSIIATAALVTGSIALIVWGSWLYQQHPGFMPPAAIILNVISLIVAYVPEGLPVTVTLSLTLIAKRMFAQRVLVRNLAIVETFNSLSLIATDKTGTITVNKMTITQLVWGSRQSFTPPAVTDPSKRTEGNAEQRWRSLGGCVDDEAFQALLLGSALCNNATVVPGGEGEEVIVGDAADTALHRMLADKLFLPPADYRAAYPRVNALPFNSKNKFMIVCNQLPTQSSAAAPTPTLLPASASKAAADDATAGAQVVCYLKGAPEVVVQRCSSIFMEREGGVGSVEAPLTAEGRKAVSAKQDSMGRAGLRVIAICRLNMSLAAFEDGLRAKDRKPDASGAELNGFPAAGYAFVGMFGLLDPPREEVADSIQKAHIAGVRVAMVTGDHATTALAIARQVHIIPHAVPEEQIHTVRLAQDELGRAVMQIIQNDKVVSSHLLGHARPAPVQPAQAEPTTRVGRVRALVKTRLISQPIEPRVVTTPTAAVITGQELKVFDDFMWDWVLQHRYLVFARTTPEQKLKIVSEAQQRHEVVAVTGDGVNDAPALKKADLGIAMQAGTDVAREAGDIVLMDNNFASIIKAMETGRVVSDNLRKVCLYLMVGGTYCEMWPVMVNVFFGLPLPLGSFEEIAVSIGTDVLDALALVQEKPEAAIMTRPPIDRRTAHLVDWKVVLQAYGILGSICTFSAFCCQFRYYQAQGLHPDCLFFAYSYGDANPYTCSANSSVSLSLAEQERINFTAQSIYYVALVIVNWFQMFATRTRYSSILQHNPLWGPGQNLWLFVSMFTGIGVAAFVLNVSWFNTTFDTHSVEIQYVAPAIGFGALLLLVDELRKWRVRSNPNGFLAKIAW